MMKLLTLVRHAKSSWQDQGCSDHDRSLNNRGLRDAPIMAERLQEHGSVPDMILCSSAKRTRETCDIFLTAWNLNASHVEYDQALYLATTGTLQSAIEKVSPEVNHVLIIAHNPGLEQLSSLLHDNAPKTLPTCAMVQFELNQASFSLDNADTIKLGWHSFPKQSVN